MRNKQNGNGSDVTGRDALAALLKALIPKEEWDEEAEGVNDFLNDAERIRAMVRSALPAARQLLKENSPLVGEVVAMLWEAVNEASKPCDVLYGKYMTGKARNIGYYLKALVKAGGLTRKEAMQVIIAERSQSSTTRLPDINFKKD